MSVSFILLRKLEVFSVCHLSPSTAIIDKTATFVAKNGPQFEERIKESEKFNNKFSFLNTNDPYRAYYDHKINLVKEGLAAPKKFEPVKVEAQPVIPIVPVKPIPKEPAPLKFLLTEIPQVSPKDLY